MAKEYGEHMPAPITLGKNYTNYQPVGVGKDLKFDSPTKNHRSLIVAVTGRKYLDFFHFASKLGFSFYFKFNFDFA